MATKTKEEKKTKKEAAVLQERAEAAVAAAAPAVVAEPASSEAPVVAAEVTEGSKIGGKDATTSEPQAEPTPRKTLPRVQIHGMERDTELGELFHKEFGDIQFTKLLLNVQILVANNAIEGELKDDGMVHINMTRDIMNMAAKQYREHREAWKTAHPQPAKPAQKSGEKNGNGNRNKEAKPKISADDVGRVISKANVSMELMKKHSADVDLSGPQNRIDEAYKAFGLEEPTESNLEKITKSCADALVEARSLIVPTQDEKVNACLKAHKLPSSQVGQMIEKQQAAKAKLEAGDREGAYQDYVALLTLIPKQASFNSRKGAMERLLEGSNTPDWYVEEGKKGLAVIIKQAEGGDLNGAHDALTVLFEKTERVIKVAVHSNPIPRTPRGKSRQEHRARR